MNQNTYTNDAPGEHPARRFVLGRRRIAALILALISAFFVLEANTYPYMDWIGPGSGFFPMWVGSLCFLTSIALFIFDRSPATSMPKSSNDPETEEVDPRRARMMVATTIGVLIAAAILLEPLGFTITGAMTIAALLWLYGSRPLVAFAVGAAGATVIFHLFAMLQVRLPTGPLGF